MKRSGLLALLTTGHAFEHWYIGLLGPVMPFLAQDMGINMTQVGILFTGRAIFSAFSSAGAGLLIDAMGGGKVLLIASLAGIALFHGGVSLVGGLWALAPVFWASGLATHLWHPPSMGLLGERFPDRKGFALGVHGTGANLGQTLAPLVAGYLLLAVGWRGVLQINMVPLLLVALLLWLCLPPFRLGNGTGKGGAVPLRQIRAAVLHNPPLLAAAVFSGVRTTVHYGIGVFLPFLLVRDFGAGPATVGLALGVYAASAILPETAVGLISDKVPRKLVVLAGLVVGGLCMLAIPSAGAGPMLFVLLALIGTFLISLRSVLFAYGFEAAPPNVAGSVVGVMFTANQVFTGLGALAAGVVADAFGTAGAFWYFGALPFLSLPLLFLMPTADLAAAPRPAPSPPAPGRAPQTP